MEIEIEGLKNLRADFARASARAGDGVMKGLQSVGLEIVAEAKLNLQRNGTNNRGTLSNSGKVQKDKDGVDAGFFTLTLTDANGGTMTRTLPVVSFEKGKRTVLNIVYSPDPSGDDDTPVTPDPEEPGEITGTFTCATYNVDG